MRGVTLVVRFLCELSMLAALGYWGFTEGEGASALVLGIGAPALAAVIWGLFVAPKAKHPVSITARLWIELVLFAASALALAATGHAALAAALAVLAAATSISNAMQERRGEPASWIAQSD
jgi:uncharacterized protein DUF2568